MLLWFPEGKWWSVQVRWLYTTKRCRMFALGLLRVLKTVDELAAVLAHEVGHVVARHPVRVFCFFAWSYCFLLRLSVLVKWALCQSFEYVILDANVRFVLVSSGDDVWVPLAFWIRNRCNCIAAFTVHRLWSSCFDLLSRADVRRLKRTSLG